MTRTSTTTRGVVFIHSAPAALCPHVEWALAGILEDSPGVQWTPQPAQPTCYRAELSWSGEPGTATRITSALRGWEHLRFEVTEDPAPGVEGERYSYTPSLGVFHAVTGLHGDIVVPEDRLRAALLDTQGDEESLATAVQALLGKAWDDELEPFRHAGDGAPVRWLHQVG